MFARVMNGVWQENVEAAGRAWQRVKTGRSGETSVDTSRSESAGRDSEQQVTLHKRLHRKLIGGLTAAIAVLALTYSAASALVTGAAGSSAARSDYATVMLAASAEYRRARAECLALPLERRDACIAEAHANEAKMRTAATTAPGKQLSQLRQKSDRLLLAAQGLDSIVIEPACNGVTRSTANVCEIQVRGSVVEAPEVLASVASPSTVPVSAVSIVPAVARAGHGARQAGGQLVSVKGTQGSHYFATVAGLVSP